MNRREFTGGLTAAALYASMRKASLGLPPANTTALSMAEPQQKFLDLRFGMYIHLNMATFEQREWGDPKASPTCLVPGISTPISGRMLPAPPGWPVVA
jgi:alpha-L-fucosidase